MLDEINEALEPYGVPPARDADDAHARVDALDNRGQRHRAAAETAVDSAANLELIAREIEDLAAEQRELFARTGLTADEESLLRDWARQRERYDKVADELRLAEHNRDLLEAALADRPELLSLNQEELDARRHQCRTAAARLERINQEIGGIEEAIDAARHSTDMETRLAELEEAAGALRGQRALDYDALAGSVLADFVVEHQQEELPGVLKRARSLLRPASPTAATSCTCTRPIRPSFRAFDTSRCEGLALDELSSGTRLQLLLAVRVAFVEQQEQGVKVPPLVLDETWVTATNAAPAKSSTPSSKSAATAGRSSTSPPSTTKWANGANCSAAAKTCPTASSTWPKSAGSARPNECRRSSSTAPSRRPFHDPTNSIGPSTAGSSRCRRSIPTTSRATCTSGT